MTLYIENPKDFTKKLLGIINKFNRVAGTKLKNILYFNILPSNQQEEKLRKKSHLQLHQTE